MAGSGGLENMRFDRHPQGGGAAGGATGATCLRLPERTIAAVIAPADSILRGILPLNLGLCDGADKAEV